MAGGDKSLIYPTMRAVVGALAIDGEIYVVGFDNEDIIGVAGWFKPGKELYSTSVFRGRIYFYNYGRRLILCI